MAAPALAMNDVDIEALRRECEEHSSSDLQQTLIALRDAGGTAHGKVTSEPPVDALAALVTVGRRARGHHPDPLRTWWRSSSTSTGPRAPAASSAYRSST